MQIPWHLHQGIFLFGPGQKVVERLAAGDVIRVSVQPERHHAVPGQWKIWGMSGTCHGYVMDMSWTCGQNNPIMMKLVA